MRILFIAALEKDLDSGAAGTEYYTLNAIKAAGHEVTEIWAEDIPRKIAHGNLHYFLELPTLYRRVLLEQLQSAPFDVTQVNQPYGYLAAKALHQLNPDTVFIHRSHGFELRVNHDLKPWLKRYKQDNRSRLKRSGSNFLNKLLTHQNRKILKYADGHIVSATQCRDYMVGLGVSSERVAVIPQAAPDSFLERPLMEFDKQRLKRILYVGQFAFFKAPMIVAEVINALCEHDSLLRFSWVCGNNHHDQVRSMLGTKAQDQTQLFDWMPQDKLLEVYDNHGIFLFPSFFEGFGKAFLEAMSRGLCVVAANNGGAHDVITSGKDGMLVETGDSSSMVRQCHSLLNDLSIARAISSEAVVTASKYTWERVAGQTISFYSDRIEAKRGWKNALHV